MVSMAQDETVRHGAREAGWGGPLLMTFVRLPLLLLGYLAFFGFFVLAGSGSPWSRTLGYANFFVSVTADVGSLLLLAWLLRREGKRLRDLIGFRRGSLTRDVRIGVGLFVVLGVAFFVASALGALVVYGPAAFDPNAAQEAQTFSYDPPLWVLWWATLVLPLTVAFAEEMTYRGYALPRLVALTGRPWIGVVIMSVGLRAPTCGPAARRLANLSEPHPGDVLGGHRVRRALPEAQAARPADRGTLGLGLPIPGVVPAVGRAHRSLNPVGTARMVLPEHLRAGCRTAVGHAATAQQTSNSNRRTRTRLAGWSSTRRRARPTLAHRRRNSPGRTACRTGRPATHRPPASRSCACCSASPCHGMRTSTHSSRSTCRRSPSPTRSPPASRGATSSLRS